MVTHSPSDEFDDPLDSVTRQWRDAPTAPGPPPSLLKSTQRRLAGSGFSSRLFRTGGAWTMAASVVIVSGLWFLHGWATRQMPLAFGDVVQKVKQFDSVRFRSETSDRGPLLVTTIVGPRLRHDVGSDMSTIADSDGLRMLMLNHAKKTAILTEVVNLPPQRRKNYNVIELIQRQDREPREEVGKQQIGSVEAVGYTVESDGVRLTIWVDPATRLPVGTEAFSGTGLNVSRDFEWGVKVDEGYMALTPPAGYQLQRVTHDFLDPKLKEKLSATRPTRPTTRRAR